MSERGEALVAHVRLERGTFSLDVAIACAPGVLLLIGPNGAGKTTLLRAILGAEPSTAARVSVGEVVLDDSSRGLHLPTEERRLAYLPQGYGLFPHLSVADNVRFALENSAPTLTKAERDARLEETAVRFGIEHLLPRAPLALSGGERQRAALARALVARPRALLLDEPLAALDPAARAELSVELGQALVEFGIPVLLVTHHPADARRLGDRVLVLEAGRVAQEGTAETLTEAPGTPFVRAFFRGEPGE